jgi:hypothetical protein
MAIRAKTHKKPVKRARKASKVAVDANGLLTRYVREVADLLKLRDYEIMLDFSAPAEADCHAEIYPHEQMSHARIRFSSDFHRLPAEDIRYYVTHELVHLHFVGFPDVLETMTTHLSMAVYQSLINSHEKAEERSVDNLAKVIAQFMPLPPALS